MKPVFQIKEFFIMVTDKNEVNLFPGISIFPAGKVLNCLPE